MGLMARFPALARAVGRVAQAAPQRMPRRELRFPDVHVERSEFAVPTRHGQVRVTAFVPDSGMAGAGVHVNVHGGGYTLGWVRQDEPLCRIIAARAGVVVLNVEHALGPGQRFPVPQEQVQDVVGWAADGARPWEGARLTVGGQSAGGALAAAAARACAEEGVATIALQLIQYPPVDLTVAPADKPAGRGAMLAPWILEVFDACHLREEADRAHPWLSPALPEHVSSLPVGAAPTVLVLCRQDRLHSEGLRWAEGLRAAGALAELIDLAGVDHAYNVSGSGAGAAERARRVSEHLADHVRAAMGGAAAPEFDAQR